MKGPAPGLPLPERRAVKMQLTPEQLQVQLDLLETQQLGLERQGVLLEQMIRDKCEGKSRLHLTPCYTLVCLLTSCHLCTSDDFIDCSARWILSSQGQALAKLRVYIIQCY